MRTVELNLGIPSQRIDASALALRLPQLAAVLAQTRLCSGISQKPMQVPSTGIFVYAAHLSVERTHVRLLKLQKLTADHASALQALCQHWCQELNLPFTFSTDLLGNVQAGNALAIGTLNTHVNLPNPAVYIEADIAQSLHASHDIELAKQLRRLFNMSHMHLHAHPITNGGVNSIWLGGDVPGDALSTAYVEQGPNGWWDTLPHWDIQASAALRAALQHGPVTLKLCTAQVELTIPLVKRQPLCWWQSPLKLNKLLQGLE